MLPEVVPMKRTLLAAVLSIFCAWPALAQDEVATLIDRGYLRQAESKLAARVAAAPTDAKALSQLARIRVEQRKPEEAIALAERAVAANPNSADAHYALAEANGAKAQKGGIGAMGPAKKFKKEAEATLALDPRYADAMVGLIEFHRQAPGLIGGDKKKIPELLDRLSAANPEKAAMRRANAAMRDKDSLQAEAILRKAAASGSTESRLALMGWLSAPWRKPDEAERIAREVVAKEPWQQGAWGTIAAIQARGRRYDELDATLAAAEAADPGRLGAMYAAARTLVTENGDLARAEKYLRKYLTTPPEIGYPSHAGAHWRLAQILEKQGKKDQAVAELQVAVRDQPDLDGAKKDLKRLSR
jgi:tetratricopeptide (TPR) repeat protein